MARAPRVAAAAIVALVIGGCTHDFDAFEGSSPKTDGGDASSDSGSGDVAVDTGNVDTTPCTPQHTCIVDAQTCAATCDSTESSCVGACGGSPSCRNKCHDTANSCRATCATACTTCTTNAGCAAPADCTAAAK